MITTQEIPQLKIQKLIRGSYITEGGIGDGNYSEGINDPLIHITSDLRGSNRSVSLKYESIDNSKTVESEILIEGLPSNLGNQKGVNLFFKCPVSGKRAKTLYYDLKTHLFVHREAYSERIYYHIQTFAKHDRIYGRSDNNDRQLLLLFLRQKKYTHQGQPTRKILRIKNRIEQKRLIEKLILDRIIKDHGEV